MTRTIRPGTNKNKNTGPIFTDMPTISPTKPSTVAIDPTMSTVRVVKLCLISDSPMR